MARFARIGGTRVEEVFGAIGLTIAGVVTGVTANKRRNGKNNDKITNHLESLAERVANIEGQLKGIEKTQDIILEHLINK